MTTVAAEAGFRSIFTLGALVRAYDEHVKRTDARGLDRLDPFRFERQKQAHFEVILRKCNRLDYQFSPYLEVLRLKGRGKPPRVISVPTVRDRVVLHIMKDYLHIEWPDCVHRTLPNAHIRILKDELQGVDVAPLAFIKADIKGFYDNIDHAMLRRLLEARLSKGRVIDQVMRAIRVPTVPAGARRSRHPNRIGVPQGLAISNILANIYLLSLDQVLAARAVAYHRYVDDILILVEPHDVDDVKSLLAQELATRKLECNEEKSCSDLIHHPFEYLGYRFQWPEVTIRTATVDRFIAALIGRFTSYRLGKDAFLARHTGLTARDYQEVFIEDLNLKLTGAISEHNRYGWVFYFQEITSAAVLHHVDAIVRRQFSTLKDFGGVAPPTVKRLVKAWREAKYNPHGGYIFDYATLDSPWAKGRYLERRGILERNRAYSQTEVDRVFEREKRRTLASLEADVGNLS